MLNKRMYLKLDKCYNSQVEPRIPESARAVEKTAMVLAGRLSLTRGEKEACREIFKNYKKEG